MGCLTSKDGNLTTYFDKIDEKKTNFTSLKQLLIDKHTVDANKRKSRGQLQLEHFFGLC